MTRYRITGTKKVVARVMDGTKVLGYVTIDRNKKLQTVNKRVFEQLALNGDIVNCTGQVYGNTINLRGIGMKLSELPKYNPQLVRIK